ncbi:FmdB family zinc ribbon protein [Caldimonas tepidiphila]|uniref:FmdB family zinc ribbon protein n=1 Tax=Caldimonas tepidiphila TaxID=2315841 RepID=UPI000E5B32AD|nr:FmdB family zinc ribbon protein [Caldimonas tepidiphila]
MPIYSYRCESCGHAQDVLQKISDPLLTDCPQCGQASFKKQLTAAGFQLKGSGWYVTDFRGGSSGASATSTAPAVKAAGDAPSASSSSTGSSDSAPAAAGCGGSCACH